jgi:predicted RNase H-like HicB family nuclease
MKKLTLKTVIWKEGKYYVAQCLNVDVSSFGKTRKEALANLSEATELFLEENTTPKITKVENPKIFKMDFSYV